MGDKSRDYCHGIYWKEGLCFCPTPEEWLEKTGKTDCRGCGGNNTCGGIDVTNESLQFEKTLNDIYNALKPGGFFAANHRYDEMHRGSANRLHDRFYNWARNKFVDYKSWF